MKNSLVALVLAWAALTCVSALSAPVVVSVTPSSQHVNVGELAAVDVRIAGLGAEVLSGFDLNFFYDGAVLGSSRSADATTAVDQLGAGAAFQFDTFSLGEWGLQAASQLSDAMLAASQADDFLLAHFTFLADANGFSSFALGLDPNQQRKFVGLNGALLDVTVENACIAVGTGSCNTVPEPSSLALLVLSLVGLAWPASRRRSRTPCKSPGPRSVWNRFNGAA
jgi:hypothetical protein